MPLQPSPLRTCRLATIGLGVLIAVCSLENCARPPHPGDPPGGPTQPIRSGTALHDGDVIFQTSKSSQSVAIQRATDSPWSHMGLIVFRDGAPLVFEASAAVRFTPLQTWIDHGEGGHYVVKRLKDADSRLTPAAREKAATAMRRFQGKKYDPSFGWSDDRLYCSELVWKIVKEAVGVEIGQPQRLREFRLDDPAVSAKLRERYGDEIPLDEPVISPAAMFAWRGFETVVEH